MATNSLTRHTQFVDNVIGPEFGSGFGLGFAVRTDPKMEQRPRVGRPLYVARRVGNLFLDRPSRKIDRRADDPCRARTASPYLAAIRDLRYGSLQDARFRDRPIGPLPTNEGQLGFSCR